MSNPYLDYLAALVAAAKVASSLTGVSVVDGPRVSSESEKLRLFFGADIDPASGLSAEGTNTPSMPGLVDEDAFTILCVAECWYGGTDIAASRVQAFAIKDAVENLVDPAPDGRYQGVYSIAFAYLGSWQLYQAQTTKGAYVGLHFRIECQTRPVPS